MARNHVLMHLRESIDDFALKPCIHDHDLRPELRPVVARVNHRLSLVSELAERDQ
jgi:hypothetical protein